MRQYDIYLNPAVGSRALAPYVVVLQQHLIHGVGTVIVAPLQRRPVESESRRVTPLVVVGDETLVLSLPELRAVERKQLRTLFGDLDHLHDLIRPAIDLLFNGV